jgi:hypothetical protein
MNGDNPNPNADLSLCAAQTLPDQRRCARTTQKWWSPVPWILCTGCATESRAIEPPDRVPYLQQVTDNSHQYEAGNVRRNAGLHNLYIVRVFVDQYCSTNKVYVANVFISKYKRRAALSQYQWTNTSHQYETENAYPIPLCSCRKRSPFLEAIRKRLSAYATLCCDRFCTCNA